MRFILGAFLCFGCGSDSPQNITTPKKAERTIKRTKTDTSSKDTPKANPKSKPPVNSTLQRVILVIAEQKDGIYGFGVTLDKFKASQKIKTIKVVKDATGLGLKEAKELVEDAPRTIKRGLTEREARTLAQNLKKVGATSSLNEYLNPNLKYEVILLSAGTNEAATIDIIKKATKNKKKKITASLKDVPSAIAKNMSAKEAYSLKEKLIKAGAKAELKAKQ